MGGGNIGPLPHIPAVAAAAPFGRFIKCCSRYRAAIMETAVGIEQHHAVSEHLYTDPRATRRGRVSQDPHHPPQSLESRPPRNLLPRPKISLHPRFLLIPSLRYPSHDLPSPFIPSNHLTGPQENLSEDYPRQSSAASLSRYLVPVIYFSYLKVSLHPRFLLISSIKCPLPGLPYPMLNLN